MRKEEAKECFEISKKVIEFVKEKLNKNYFRII